MVATIEFHCHDYDLKRLLKTVEVKLDVVATTEFHGRHLDLER